MGGAVATARLPLPPWAVAVGALGLGFVLGVGLAFDLRIGAGLVLGVAFAVLALVDLPLAIAAWLGVLFVRNLPIVWIAPLAGLLTIAAAWFGLLRPQGSWARLALAAQRRPLLLMGGLLTWLGLSAAWSEQPGRVLDDLGPWLLAALTFLVVVGAVHRPRDTLVLAAAFVAGGVVSVAVGLVDIPGFEAPTGEDVSSEEGRLGGGRVNPNDLATVLVPAIALAAGLAASWRGTRRVLAVLAVAFLAYGLAATGSRGGTVAALAAVGAALFLAGDRRVHLVTALLLMLGGAAVWFSQEPDSFERITAFDEGGTGRTDLWQVALRIYGDNPLAGVGLNQFELASPSYVRDPGTLEYVDLIVDQQLEVHNIYLELLVEAGPVAVVLFLALLVSCLTAAWRAGRMLDDAGDRAFAAVARAVAVGIVAVATALVFSSNVLDLELWVLLGLGAALPAVARRRVGGVAA